MKTWIISFFAIGVVLAVIWAWPEQQQRDLLPTNSMADLEVPLSNSWIDQYEWPELSAFEQGPRVHLSQVKNDPLATKRTKNQGLNAEFIQPQKRFYFDVCGGKSIGSDFHPRDLLLGSIYSECTEFTTYLTLFNQPAGGPRAYLFVQDKRTGKLLSEAPEVFLSGRYRASENWIDTTNLNHLLPDNPPDLWLHDVNGDGTTDIEINRLFHNGTANAHERTVLSVANGRIDTVSFDRTWL